MGLAGIANARLAYRAYEEKFAGDRFAALKADGANTQRPLWASTGVKNPDYRDTMYVTDLAVAAHRQHDAREDDAGLRRPRRRRRRPGHRPLRRGPAGHGRPGPARTSTTTT